MALRDKGKKAIKAFVNESKFFKHATVEGTHMLFGLGKLPEPFRSELSKLDWVGVPVRILYSYQTPIAWKTAHGPWVCPDVRYSTTTTNHQNVARTAIREAELKL